MSDRRKGAKTQRIVFINPGSQKSFEELLRTVLVEKLKKTNS